MQDQPLTFTAVIAALVLAVLALGLLVARYRRQHTAQLREHFGPEYDRALEQYGSRARAERELTARKRRLEKLQIRLLSPEESQRFGAAWSDVQQHFVDDPPEAVSQADALVKEVMSVRGYPTGDFEQCVADLSVEHANMVHHYRAARKIVEAKNEGQAETEDLRQAIVLYRALFSELLQAYEPHPALSQARPSTI
jgi:hypothetical protein